MNRIVNQKVRPSSAKALRLAMLAGLSLVVSDASAALVSMINTDAVNTTSFNTGLNWADSTAPSAANDYFTGGFTLRTPGTGSHTFAGNSLQVDAGGTLAIKTPGPVTINNLRMNGGQISHFGVGGTEVATLAGSISLLTNSSFNSSVSPRELIVQANITGAGQLNVAGSSIITLTGNYSASTINVNGGTLALGAGSGDGINPAGGVINIASGAVLRNNAANRIQNGVRINVGGTYNLNNSSDVIGSVAGAGSITLGSATLTLDDMDGSVFSGTLAGTGGLTLRGNITQGTQTLSNANTYSGTTRIEKGVLRITNGNALGTTAGGTTIVGNTGGSGILELTNGIAVGAETFTLEARQAGTLNIPHIRNVSGDNSIAGNMNLNTGGSDYNIESAADLLTLTGNITNTNTGTRRIKFFGAGEGVHTGSINVNAAGDNELVKNGTGTWTINNAANLNEVFVNQGVLNITGNVGGTTTVAALGTVGGTGTFTGNTTTAASSLISPGFSIGTLGFAGNLDINGGVLIEVDPAAAGQKIDIINVGGLLDITGAALTFDFLSSPIDGAYVFGTYGSLLGEFASISGMPFNYVVDYKYQGTNQIALVSIPEPATMSLLALAGLGILRRRRVAC